MLGNFHSHIRVIFWLLHVVQEPASLHERQQNQQLHITAVFFGSNVQPKLFRIPGPVFVAVKHCMMALC